MSVEKGISAETHDSKADQLGYQEKFSTGRDPLEYLVLVTKREDLACRAV